MSDSGFNDIADLLQSRHVIDLLTVANEYCLFIENSPDYKVDEMLDSLRRMVPLIYIKGSILPSLVTDEDYITEKFVSEEHWENIYKAMKGKFDEIPAESWPDQQKQAALLAEILADIYQDLKDFVVLFQKALTIEKQNALADCQQAFQPFWGNKLALAMPLLHALSGADTIGGIPDDTLQGLWDE